MTENAQGKLSDGLKQALEEAQATQTKQLEQFIQNQTQELKEVVQDSVAKGTHEVVEKLDMIHKEISKQSQQSQNVSYTAKFLWPAASYQSYQTLFQYHISKQNKHKKHNMVLRT